jgi:hypothetical protein
MPAAADAHDRDGALHGDNRQAEHAPIELERPFGIADRERRDSSPSPAALAADWETSRPLQ